MPSFRQMLHVTCGIGKMFTTSIYTTSKLLTTPAQGRSLPGRTHFQGDARARQVTWPTFSPRSMNLTATPVRLSLVAILFVIGGVELNPGPDVNIVAIIVMMFASPRMACCGQEPTGERSFLIILCQFHALTKTALMLHALTIAVLSSGHNDRHAQERPYFDTRNSR